MCSHGDGAVFNARRIGIAPLLQQLNLLHAQVDLRTGCLSCAHGSKRQSGDVHHPMSPQTQWLHAEPFTLCRRCCCSVKETQQGKVGWSNEPTYGRPSDHFEAPYVHTSCPRMPPPTCISVTASSMLPTMPALMNAAAMTVAERPCPCAQWM